MRAAPPCSVSEKLACGDLFRQVCAVRLLRLRLRRAADGVSLDSEYSLEGLRALQASHKGLGTVARHCRAPDC